ncbi:PREDICTED: uncharacterized protein At1g32220, chloroplastic [Tarenaya hassleriana]|uniref:NAD(P)-binding domain-containing protein n=1 Tax=Tarenaya spinosa TaxID=228870 RepID=Q1KUW8_9ROSI|nr:PREDICTED: uncharacterized protein At1g32220, chloroplastic [Tarenaya hassleriana]ABD96868.1 hypothetical protein [Tarenaya spinosa]
MLRSLVQIRSRASPVATISSMNRRGNERLLSSTSSDNSSSEHLKAENAKSNGSNTEDRILVLGGNGYVGSHICQEALRQGLVVSSLSRSGRYSLHENDSWVENVTWHQGDLLSPDSLKPALDGVTSVISCVGGFGSNSHMFKINGTANINAVKAAAEQGVKRFVYISAADFGIMNYLLRGYYEGKRATEAEILDKFSNRGIILRPGFIHGTRQVGRIKLPLSIIGGPLEMVLKHAKFLTKVPLVGPLLIPPVKVTSVAKVAVHSATADLDFPSGVIDVHQILHLGQ